METKQCSKCKETKTIDKFFMRNDKRNIQSWCKVCTNQNNHLYAIDRKKQIIALMGGGCSICGYNKSIVALELHHTNPQEKDAQWTQIRNRKWERVLEEIRKCILVCSNCHKEIHSLDYPQYDYSLSVDHLRCDRKLNGLYDGQDSVHHPKTEYNQIITPTGLCPICSVDVFGTKYCSHECSNLGMRQVIRPTKEQLEIDTEKLSWRAIGRKYGVSDNAVRKWAKYYGMIE